MSVSRANLADFVYFLAIARHQSFSKAGREVGISASALSHAIKALETRIGVRLLNRTTRSVTLTDAGERLHQVISAPMQEIDGAMEILNKFRDDPTGRIRLNILSDAADLLLGPVLPEFTERYPEIQIDLTVTNLIVDVIGEGHDAGIRYGGTVPEDMIAQRLSPDIRWVVAGTPDYLQRFGVPKHPDDLHNHRCLRIRLGSGVMYKWEFEKDEEKLEVAVPGTITIDETRVGLSLVRNGAGLMYAPEPAMRSLIDCGEVVTVLDDWASVAPGFHMYFSSHRQIPTGLRLLIDLIREIQPLGE
ncbi:LysR family transcriptional regulator [Pseudomonas sp. M47T1]|uniref:LysR family transcriptional regulator n=1 Tax=Pseudomonas sp. M47T1 TaxID=1179778 RepID=UPI0002607328|nr:LysR family transcriptional regulator [Pseudomonas sp. M47T1]EIK94398.1 LysR family transcriptional regulator [Pseudomonas sp. M47T1]